MLLVLKGPLKVLNTPYLVYSYNKQSSQGFFIEFFSPEIPRIGPSWSPFLGTFISIFFFLPQLKITESIMLFYHPRYYKKKFKVFQYTLGGFLFLMRSVED